MADKPDPESRWFKLGVFFAIAAFVTACALELSGSRRITSIADLQYGRFQAGILPVADLRIPEGMTMNVFLHVPCVKRKTFKTLMPKTVKGNCLPSGLREDFCHMYGQLDTASTLFSLIPSCRGVLFANFLGGCRASRDKVVDYCITTADVNWAFCRQKQVACVAEYISTTPTIFRVSNATSPMLHVPLNVTLDNTTTALVFNLLVSAAAGVDTVSDVIVALVSFNGNLSLTRHVYAQAEILFDAFVPVKLEVTVNASVNGIVLQSADLLLAGVSIGSAVIVDEIYVSSCASELANLTVSAPECYLFSPVLAGTSHISLDVSVPDPNSFAGDTVYAGGLLSAPVASDDILQSVEGTPYTLVVLSPRGYQPDSAWISNNAVIYDADGNTQRRDAFLFSSDTAYYKFASSVTQSTMFVIPTILLATLRIAWYYPIHIAVTFYEVSNLACLSSSNITSAAPVFDETLTQQVVYYTNISFQLRDQTNVPGLFEHNYGFNALGYAQFTIRAAFTLMNDDVAHTKVCYPLIRSTSTLPQLYLLMLEQAQNVDGELSMTMPILLHPGNYSVVYVLIGTIWDRLVRPPAVLGSVTVEGLVCAIDPNITLAREAAQTLRGVIANRSALYMNTSSITLTSGKPHENTYSFASASIFPVASGQPVNAQIANFPHSNTLPAVNSSCDVYDVVGGGSCLIPYTPPDEYWTYAEFATVIEFKWYPFSVATFVPLTAMGVLDKSRFDSTPVQINYDTDICDSYEFTFYPFGVRRFSPSYGVLLGGHTGNDLISTIPRFSSAVFIQLNTKMYDADAYVLCMTSQCFIPDPRDSSIKIHTLHIPHDMASAIRGAYPDGAALSAQSTGVPNMVVLPSHEVPVSGSILGICAFDISVKTRDYVPQQCYSTQQNINRTC